MSIWAVLAGGFVGTLVLTTVLRTASELHLTRMDLPFLLGTVVTADRRGQGDRLRRPLRLRAGVRSGLLRTVRRDRPARLVAGRAVRAGGRACSPAPSWSTSCCRWCTRGWERRSAMPGLWHCSNRPGSCSATTGCRPRGQPRGTHPVRHDHRTLHPGRLTRRRVPGRLSRPCNPSITSES